MRKEIIAGNWKMNKTISETKKFFNNFVEDINTLEREVCLFVPYLSLSEALSDTLNSNIAVGAQNMHFENNGAFTGEISAQMLCEIGVKNVLIGHSERRLYFNETDETVNLKIKKAIECGIRPFVCVGENLAQREENLTFDVIEKQISNGLNNIDIDKIVLAYEPVWAIGTGKTATDEQAEEVCAFIRKNIEVLYDDKASNVRILYGGSVNSSNIKNIMAMPNIDGVLVGGASLKEDFVKIVNYDK